MGTYFHEATFSDWISPAGISLDLIGFTLLAWLLHKDNRRLKAVGTLLKLNRCFAPVRGQYLGMEKITAQLLNETDEKKRKAISLLEPNMADLKQCIFEARGIPCTRDEAKHAHKIIKELRGSHTLRSYNAIVEVFLKLEQESEQLHQPSNLVGVAVRIVILGFFLQLLGAVPFNLQG